jgi:hypothetical protein
VKRSFILVLVCVCLLIVGVYLWWPGQESDEARRNASSSDADAINRQMSEQASTYDWARSRKNLEHIGRLVSAERARKRLRPSEQWRSQNDTGLDPSALIGIIASLPKEMRFVESRHRLLDVEEGPGRYTSQYTVLFAGMESVLSEDELDTVWALRAEDLPIVMDSAMYSDSLMMRSTEKFKVLVLRLGGRVDEVHVEYGLRTDSQARKDLLLKH